MQVALWSSMGYGSLIIKTNNEAWLQVALWSWMRYGSLIIITDNGTGAQAFSYFTSSQSAAIHWLIYPDLFVIFSWNYVCIFNYRVNWYCRNPNLIERQHARQNVSTNVNPNESCICVQIRMNISLLANWHFEFQSFKLEWSEMVCSNCGKISEILQWFGKREFSAKYAGRNTTLGKSKSSLTKIKRNNELFWSRSLQEQENKPIARKTTQMFFFLKCFVIFESLNLFH